MKAIYKFVWRYHRMGEVSGAFVANKSDIEDLIGKDVYFGEVLGKNSEIYGIILEGDLEMQTDDQKFIKEFEKVMGEDWYVGYNPLHYV